MNRSLCSPAPRLEPGDGARARPLARLAEWSTRRPWLTVAAGFALAVLSMVLAAGRLELLTSNLDLVDPDLPEVARFLAFSAEFGTPNVLIVGVEGDDREAVRRAATRVAATLATVPGVAGVDYRLPFNAEALGWHGIDPYFASQDGLLALVFVQPDDPHARASTLAPMLDEVERRMAALNLGGSAGGIRLSTTGLPRYAVDDRDTIRDDVSVLSIVAFGLILALFAAAFASFLHPLVAMLALVSSVAVTLGGAALYPGHLTLVSAFFASILFGLGVDFGIHVIDSFEGLLAEGRGRREAILAAVTRLEVPLALAAATTASAFFALGACGFRGFAELGVIAGAGILICLLGTFTLLPALLLLVRRRSPTAPSPDQRRIGRWLARPRRAVALALCALAAVALLGPPEFDGNYLDLQPRGSKAVRLEREIVARSGWSPQFAVFTVRSKEAAWDLVSSLRDEATVGEVRSIVDLDELRYLGVASQSEEAALRSRFESPQGRFAVYAYPAGDIWDASFQGEFLERMRALDPTVTGMPFLGEFMVERSRRALTRGAAVSAAAVLLWLWLGFRRWLPALLALLPAALGIAATAAVMRWSGLRLNPIDVMAFPVIIGIAVDDGIHLVHRFLAEEGEVTRTLAGAGRSVVLTSATSVAAFGALAWARHRGLASLGLTLALGVSLALAFSVLVLPRVLVASARWLLPRERGSRVGSTAASAARGRRLRGWLLLGVLAPAALCAPARAGAGNPGMKAAERVIATGRAAASHLVEESATLAKARQRLEVDERRGGCS